MGVELRRECQTQHMEPLRECTSVQLEKARQLLEEVKAPFNKCLEGGKPTRANIFLLPWMLFCHIWALLCTLFIHPWKQHKVEPRLTQIIGVIFSEDTQRSQQAPFLRRTRLVSFEISPPAHLRLLNSQGKSWAQKLLQYCRSNDCLKNAYWTIQSPASWKWWQAHFPSLESSFLSTKVTFSKATFHMYQQYSFKLWKYAC